jgi:hypothetical protein
MSSTFHRLACFLIGAAPQSQLYSLMNGDGDASPGESRGCAKDEECWAV